MIKSIVAICALTPLLALGEDTESKPVEVSQTIDTNGIINVVVESDSMLNSYAGGDRQSATKLAVTPGLLPKTVDQVTPLMLADAGITEVKDIVPMLPGVYNVCDEQNGLLLGRLMIRGFQATYPNHDGMRIHSGGKVDINMMECTDIVKGPASLMYGCNNVGGVVNYVTKGAHLERPYSTSILASTTDTGRYRVAGESGGRVTDKYASCVGFNYQDGQTYRDLLRRTISANLGQYIQFSEDTSFDLRAVYTRETREMDAGVPIVNGKVVGSVKDNWMDIGNDAHRGATFDDVYVNAALNHRFNDYFSEKSQFLFHYMHADWDAWRSSNYNVKQQLMTSSLDCSKHDAAEYQYRQQIEWKYEDLGWLKNDMIGAIDLSIYDYAWEGHMGCGPTLYRYANGSGYIDNTYKSPTAYRKNREQHNYYIAPSWHDHLTLFDSLHAIGGVRWDWYQAHNSGMYSPFTGRQGGWSKQTDRAWTYDVGLIYELTDWLHPYVSYSTSFDPQTATTYSGEQIDPSRGKQWEVGFKSPLFSEKLMFSACWFYLDKDHIAKADPEHDGYSIDIGEQNSTGVELSLHGAIGKYFDVMAAYAHTDTSTGNTDSKDYSFTGVPKNSGSLWAVYRMEGVGQPLGFRCGAGVKASDKMPLTNDESVNLDGYWTLDLMAGYGLEIGDGHVLDFQVNLYNVADQEYYTHGSYMQKGTGNYIKGYPGQPFGGQFTIKYTF